MPFIMLLLFPKKFFGWFDPCWATTMLSGILLSKTLFSVVFFFAYL